MQQIIIDNLTTIITATTSLLLSIINLGVIYFRTRTKAIQNKANGKINLDDYYIKIDNKEYSLNDIKIMKKGE